LTHTSSITAAHNKLQVLGKTMNNDSSTAHRVYFCLSPEALANWASFRTD